MKLLSSSNASRLEDSLFLYTISRVLNLLVTLLMIVSAYYQKVSKCLLSLRPPIEEKLGGIDCGR